MTLHYRQPLYTFGMKAGDKIEATDGIPKNAKGTKAKAKVIVQCSLRQPSFRSFVAV